MEHVAFPDELFAERGVILDDPVVDEGEFAALVKVRVRTAIWPSLRTATPALS
jgi:hypothetical protein